MLAEAEGRTEPPAKRRQTAAAQGDGQKIAGRQTPGLKPGREATLVVTDNPDDALEPGERHNLPLPREDH